MSLAGLTQYESALAPHADRRLLIISCSKRKRVWANDQPIPAGELYDGVFFRTIRAWQRTHDDPGLFILIVSARYGLIDWHTVILPYERRMTPRQALEMRPQVAARLRTLWHLNPREVRVELGKDYVPALPELLGFWAEAHIENSQGRIGARLRALHSWLRRHPTR